MRAVGTGKALEPLPLSCFLYELAVGLWDFLAGAWLGILWDDPGFVTPGCVRQLIPVWLVRVGIAVIALVLARQPKQGTGRMPLVSGVSVAGFIAAVSVSAQNRLPLPADTIDRWVLLALILLLSLLFYRLNRQRAMEQEIAALKQAQAEIVERDYRALRKTYADNAKLYHDLHNHIEAIYQCLAQETRPKRSGTARRFAPRFMRWPTLLDGGQSR